jgi:hypothetical protein
LISAALAIRLASHVAILAGGMVYGIVLWLLNRYVVAPAAGWFWFVDQTNLIVRCFAYTIFFGGVMAWSLSRHRIVTATGTALASSRNTRARQTNSARRCSIWQTAMPSGASRRLSCSPRSRSGALSVVAPQGNPVIPISSLAFLGRPPSRYDFVNRQAGAEPTHVTAGRALATFQAGQILAELGATNRKDPTCGRLLFVCSAITGHRYVVG